MQASTSKGGFGGLVKLHHAVKTCEYEDVHSLWEIVKRYDKEFTDASALTSFAPFCIFQPLLLISLRISCFCLLYFVTEMILSFIPISRMGINELIKHTRWYF
nr:Ran-binding protein like [Ipomoea batatas]